MNDRTASRLARMLGGLCVLLGVGFVLIVPHAPKYSLADALFQGATALTGVSFGVVGAVIASRQRDNVIGWLFLAIGVSMGLTAAIQTYAGNAPSGVVTVRRPLLDPLRVFGAKATLISQLAPTAMLAPQPFAVIRKSAALVPSNAAASVVIASPSLRTMNV